MATNVTNGRISNMNWAFSHSRLTANQVAWPVQEALWAAQEAF